MATESTWVSIWTVVLAVGLGTFFLLVAIVMPLGARDIKRLFAELDGKGGRKDDD